MKISSKIRILFVMLVIAVTLCVIVIIQFLVVPWHLQIMEQRAIDKAYYLQKVAPLLSLAEQQTLLEKLSSNEQDLAYFLILDKNGRALVHNNPQRVGMLFNDQGTMQGLSSSSGVYKHQYIRDQSNPSSAFYGERVLDIMIPYYDKQGNHSGAVNVGISLQRVREAREYYYQIVGLLAILLSLMFWLAYRYIFKEIINPIKDISLATRGLREGQFSRIASLERGDEIGDLAREFDLTADRMTQLLSGLQVRQKELQDYIDQLMTMNGKLTPDGTFLMANAGTAAVAKLGKNELSGSKIWNVPGLNYPEAEAHLKELVARAATGATVHNEEFTIYGDEYKVIEMGIRPVIDQAGEVNYLVMEGFDISSRKRIEEALLDSEKKLKKQVNYLNTLIDNINEFFYICDLDGRLSFANKKSWQTFGYSVDEALNKTMEKFVPELYREKLIAEIKYSLETGNDRVFEIPILYQDGRECLVRVHMSAIIEDGEITGGMALAEDITMYRLAQDSLRKAHDELEMRVKERTIELEKINNVLKTQIMERKRIEEALLTSEGNLRTQVTYLNTLINNLNELFFTYDATGQVNFVNHRSIEVLGFEPNELVGTTVPNLVPEHCRQKMMEQISCRINNGEYASYDIPFLHKDGSERLIRLNGSPIVEEGVITGGMALCEDITEYGLAEEALRISEEKFATAFRLSPEAISINSLDEGRYIDVNDAWLQYSNYSREDIIGKTPRELDIMIDPEIFKQQKILLAERERGFLRNLEISYPDKNGHMRLGLCSMATITINQELCVLMVVSDITERKAIEEDLAREKERLMVTLKSIGDGVISTDIDGRITLVNEAAEKVLDKKQDELIGRDFSSTLQTLNPRFSKSQKASYADLGSVDVPSKTFYNMFLTLNGEERCIEANRATINNREGSFVGLVWAIRDTTDKQKMEEELLKASKLDSLGVLAGGIAHDFNNLLTVIVGNLALGKMSLEEDDELIELLTEAEKASFQAKGLTQQLLTFARGGAPIRKITVIADLLRDSVKISLSGSNIISEIAIAEDLWPVNVDSAQISQVCNNLIINAMQAMPEGGSIKITADNITTADEEISPLPAGRYVRIAVADKGIGIPEDIQAKIYDPYFTTKPSGSGLGLATSYSIIRKHDGYITAHSSLGEGTTFYVYLPASREGPPEDLNQQLIMTNGRGKILVMDDDEQVREVAGHILDSIGYEVQQASDGNEALALYSQAMEMEEAYDVVIIDLTIPGGMGGEETARKILEIDPHARLIVSSGYSNDPIMANYEKWGFKGVIPKPYGVKELSETIARIVKE